MTEPQRGDTEDSGDNARKSGGASNIARSMVRGTLATMVHRIVEAVAALFVLPFTLHRLGTDAYGLWALFYSVTLYLNLADFGFAAALNRHFVTALESNDSHLKKAVFSTGLSFMLVIATVIIAVGLLFESWFIAFFPDASEFAHVAPWVWKSMVLVLALGFITNYGRYLFFATHRTGHLAIFNTGLALFNAGTIVFVLSLGWGLIGLAGGVVTVGVVRMLITFIFGVAGVKEWSFSPAAVNRETLKSMWSFGMTVQLTRIADVINQQFDRILLGRVAGLDSVTHYDVGAKAANSANLIPTTLYYVIEPAAATFSAQGDKQRFTSLLLRSGKYMSLIALPIGVYLNLAAVFLLTLWLGSVPHSEMILAIRFLAVAYIAWTVTVPLRLCARGAGHPSWEALAATVQAVLNVALSISFYYLFGFIGVLYGTVTAALVGQTVMTIRALVGLQQPMWTFFRVAWIGPVLASLGAGLAAWALLQVIPPLIEGQGRLDTLPGLLLSGIGFGVVYGLLLLGLRVLSWKELKELVGFVKRR